MFPPTLLNRYLQHLPLIQDVCQCRLLDLYRQRTRVLRLIAVSNGSASGNCTARPEYWGLLRLETAAPAAARLRPGVLRLLRFECRTRGMVAAAHGHRVLGIITIGSSTCGAPPRAPEC
jgi:hypothetical protein